MTDYKDPNLRMAHARSFPRSSPGRPKVDEKSIYEKTLKQVMRILDDKTIEPELKSKYHFAILRWQGKLDAVDDKQLEELKKLMGKKAS